MMKYRGFTLIEIAIVLVIISVLITIVAVPLAAQRELSARAETSKQLELAKEALVGFALANGRLPCPALVSGACTTGRECFCAEQTSTTGTCTPTPIKPTPAANYIGRCAAFGSTGLSLSVGFLPASTLGIAPTDNNGFALDGYNTSANIIYYAVSRDPVVGLNFALTNNDGIKAATMSAAGWLAPMLTVCPTSALTCTSANSLTSAAPFVLFSLGANAATPYASLSAKEQANLDNDTSHIFVSGTKDDMFDDILTWGSTSTLFGRMAQAGKLP